MNTPRCRSLRCRRPFFGVGTAGFEPATPGPPDQCANQAAPRPEAVIITGPFRDPNPTTYLQIDKYLRCQVIKEMCVQVDESPVAGRSCAIVETIPLGLRPPLLACEPGDPLVSASARSNLASPKTRPEPYLTFTLTSSLYPHLYSQGASCLLYTSPSPR